MSLLTLTIKSGDHWKDLEKDHHYAASITKDSPDRHKAIPFDPSKSYTLDVLAFLGCNNCIGCIGCNCYIGCICCNGCICCIDCTGCIGFVGCWLLAVLFYFLLGCLGFNLCIGCTDCVGCISCIRCFECIGHISCFKCIGCINWISCFGCIGCICDNCYIYCILCICLMSRNMRPLRVKLHNTTIYPPWDPIFKKHCFQKHTLPSSEMQNLFLRWHSKDI